MSWIAASWCFAAPIPASTSNFVTVSIENAQIIQMLVEGTGLRHGPDG